MGKPLRIGTTKNMTAIILAGGKSSRMGRDKSHIEFNGEPLLIRTVRTLKDMFDEIIVVTNKEIKFSLPGARVVYDEVPFQGPLGGISAGLKASSHDINLVIAVDMPFISPHVVEYLSELAYDADVVVPRTREGLEPLFAFYNKRCLPVIDQALAEGERKVAALYEKFHLRVIGFQEMKHLEGVDRAFININTEKELEEAIELDKGGCKEPEEEQDCFRADISDDPEMPVERAMTIYVNSEELVTVQSSLEHLDELACGFLVAEGILQERNDLQDIRINEDRGEVRVRTRKTKLNASKSMGKRFVTSGCGKGFSFVSLGDALGITRLNSQYKISAESIPELMKEFLKGSRRPGMHSSALAKDGEIRFIRQDIGRHNTVDMLLGRLWLDEVDERDLMIFTTGRISYEMVVKAAKARIPVLVSRTAATSMAVELAKRLGIEIIGYVRGSKAKVYTSGSRLMEGQ